MRARSKTGNVAEILPYNRVFMSFMTSGIQNGEQNYWCMTTFYVVFALLTNLLSETDRPSLSPTSEPALIIPMDCNCTITQSGSTYPISALLGNETAVEFYSYGVPDISSANTGLELQNGLIIFLYEDTNTGVISLFLIADIANDGTGGTMEFEANCLPDNAFVSVQDDPGEFFGSPPLITGNWSWSDCCTDGGVIEDIGCNNTLNLDLLVSSGLDSIVWLTGDIADPDQILLNMNGDAITINCGGGVCCPVGFDTEIEIINASCPDTQDGSIDISPKDGLPPYTYQWSNGATTEDLTDLMHGTYEVTITDSQGCTDELTISVALSPGIPPAEPTGITLCSESTEAIFDLTSVENIINLGMGFIVLWFQNADMTGPIGNPSSYLSGTATVYAVVDNGACISDPVPITLEVILEPVATPTTVNACEEENGMATFDLTDLQDIVSGGLGSVAWYLDADLSNPISDPTEFLTASTTVYAIVNDGTCISNPAAVELIVDPKPEGNATGAELCGDEYNEATFDLTLLDNTISGGLGTVEWFFDQELTDPIVNPTEFLTNSTTVYATVFDGICYSDPIAIVLSVETTPEGNPVTAELCDDGTGMALFNLFDYNAQVSGGQGVVEWYYDLLLLDPIPFPESFNTVSTVVYATVDNGICISAPIEVTLNVIQSPVGNPTFIETCADNNGQGTFDLTSVNTEVSGGIGSVLWFEDAQGNLDIENDTAYQSSGSTVYAQVINGECESGFVPVSLVIVDSVSAAPALYELCDNGNGMAVFNLPSIDDAVSGGSGQVTWYLDPLTTMVINAPQTFLSGDTIVYATVTAGDCISDAVPITLMILASPQATSTSIALCGNAEGEATIDLTAVDTLISGNVGVVLWYGDAMLGMSIPDPNAFFTGDTIVYAVVSNGACTSPPVAIPISVSQGISAFTDTMELCIPAGDTLPVSLRQSDLVVSGGSGIVNWFIDPAGLMAILNPVAFPISTSTTVYANVSVGECTSALVPVELIVAASPVATPVTLQRCGDANGEAIFDLTAYDTLVSGNTGFVLWFGDPAATLEIPDPTSFTSGDTILYAVVGNVFCGSLPVPVTLNVVDSLAASAITIEECVIGNGMATLNLTQSDFAISAGGGTVFWFTDVLGTDTITNTTAFVSGDNIIYAVVAADGCVSDVVPVIIDIANADTPQLDCAFSSIDSIVITWTSIANNFQISYTINGQPIGAPVVSSVTEFHLGNLAQGDEVTLSVSALFDLPCMPMTTSITCTTEVCPPQYGAFTAIPVSSCRNDMPFVLAALPFGIGQFMGDGVVGNTFFPNLVTGDSAIVTYSWDDAVTGCSYSISESIVMFDPLSPPMVDCKSNTLSSVSFEWTASALESGYMYSINNGPVSQAFMTTTDSVLVANLNEGDAVTLFLWSIGNSPCGNSDTVSVTCITKQCELATVVCVDPGPLCSQDDPIQLDVVIGGLSGTPTITWTGTGITSPAGIFDPALAGPGTANVFVTVDADGCVYQSFLDIQVLQQPDATFEVSGTPCLDSSLHVTFTGQAFGNSEWNWELDGGTVVSGSLPLDFSVQWPSPGDYALNLQINWNICSSEPFSIPVQIDAPLDTPVISCVEEDYYSIIIEWESIPGATQYAPHKEK